MSDSLSKYEDKFNILSNKLSNLLKNLKNFSKVNVENGLISATTIMTEIQNLLNNMNNEISNNNNNNEFLQKYKSFDSEYKNLQNEYNIINKNYIKEKSDNAMRLNDEVHKEELIENETENNNNNMNNSRKNNDSFGGGIVDMNNFDNSFPNIENPNNITTNLNPQDENDFRVKQEHKNKKFIISMSILIIVVILGLSICLSLYTKKTDKK